LNTAVQDKAARRPVWVQPVRWRVRGQRPRGGDQDLRIGCTPVVAEVGSGMQRLRSRFAMGFDAQASGRTNHAAGSRPARDDNNLRCIGAYRGWQPGREGDRRTISISMLRPCVSTRRNTAPRTGNDAS
jgi:hypothetical protein